MPCCYASIMARSEASNSSKTWNVPLYNVRSSPPLSRLHTEPRKRGHEGYSLGAAPDLHRVDLHRRIQLDSVLLTASNIEDPGGNEMA